MKQSEVIIKPLTCGAVKAVIKGKYDVRLTIMQLAYDDENCITPARSIEMYGTKDLAELKSVVDAALKAAVEWSE